MHLGDRDMTGEAGYEGSGPGKWLTIPQAAEYLGVSEPTIYRWMRQGILTYFKVGGGTRFTVECLDAVVEKSTGRREGEVAQGRCAVCGDSRPVPGRLQAVGRLYFRPHRTRFWVLEEALVPVEARTCLVCGHVQMQADLEKLNRLLRKADTMGEGPEDAQPGDNGMEPPEQEPEDA
jgi:excisionase family DNA binding protein